MRSASAWLVPAGIAAGSVCAALGCTFLVSFDDQASCDGGLCTDAGDTFDGAAADAPSQADGASTVDGGDASDAAMEHDAAPTFPCRGLVNGLYCAGDHLVGYQGPSSDLVTCDGGAVYRVHPCGSAGCLSMKDPFADTCNECPTKVDGMYCGRDFAGFPPDDSDILIGCQSGNVVIDFLCPHGCRSAGSDAACY